MRTRSRWSVIGLTVVSILAAGALPAFAAKPVVAITGDFDDACRDFSAQSTRDIAQVHLSYADGRRVKAAGGSPTYSIDGGADDELASVRVKSGPTTETFECTGPPVAVLEVLSAGGGFASYRGSNSTDADGAIVSWVLDFGDGSSVGGPWSNPPVDESHSYGAGGNYTVTLTVTDDDGLTGEATAVVNVGETGIEPFAVLEVVQDDPSLPPYFRGSSSLDPDGTLVSWSIDFGDGEGTGGDWDTNPPVEVHHAYAAPGTYLVSLTVVDNSGMANTATEFVTIP